MSGTPHLSATAPSELDLNGQPNESELQLRCHSDQSGHRPLMTMEPMNIVPVADNSTPRTGRTLSGVEEKEFIQWTVIKSVQRRGEEAHEKDLKRIKTLCQCFA